MSECYTWLEKYAIMKLEREFTYEFPVNFEEVIHAEAMAIAKLSDRVSGCTMYCTLEPCVPCAEYVINSRQIVEFRYLWDYADERKHKAHLFESGVPLLEKAGIKVGRIET
jgi:deoxycytidylate deaminase